MIPTVLSCCLHPQYIAGLKNASCRPSVLLYSVCLLCKEFDNRALSKIFWAYGKEMTRYWRKLHSEELRDLYFHDIVLE